MSALKIQEAVNVRRGGTHVSLRYEWVDVLKFLGIFAVYLGHFGEAGGKFYPFVFSYHVPLFFMAGGFFHKTPRFREFGGYVLDKFKRIMVPYFIFMALKLVLMHIVYNVDLTQNLYEIVLGRRNQVGPAWFLTGFFSAVVIYALLHMVFRNRYVVLVITFFLHAYYGQILTLLRIEPLSVIWNLDSDINYLFYYSLGHCVFPLLQKLEWRKDKGWKENKLYILLACFSAAVTAIVFVKGTGFVYSALPFPEIFRIKEISVTLAVILFNCFLAKSMTGISGIQELGKNTLILCGCEEPIKLLLTSALAMLRVTILLADPITTIMYTGICLVACYAIFVRFALKRFPPMAGSFPKKK